LSDEEQIEAVKKLLESGNPLSPDAWNELGLGGGGSDGTPPPVIVPDLPDGIVDAPFDFGNPGDCVPILGQGC
jgi:hypothetical protein